MITDDMTGFTQKLMPIDFTRSRILVVGDLMLDSYLHGNISRISPEAPVPILNVVTEELRVGGSGNVAMNIAALDAQATLLALVGNDAYGEMLHSMITDAGVASQLILRDNKSTIVKQRVVSNNHQLLRIDHENNFKSEEAGHILTNFEQLLPHVDIIVLSDYDKGTLGQVEQLIYRAKAAGKPVLVDPKGTDFNKYSGATLITPNLQEFEAVMGGCKDDNDIAVKATAMLEELDLSAVLITKSRRGMTLVCRERPPLHLPTFAREVFDVTGAGDTVIATLAAAIGAKVPLSAAVDIANAAAGLAVGKFGTSTVSINELRGNIQHQLQGNKSKIVEDIAELTAITSTLKAKGEILVLTNGCFDILHPGHVDYLKRARELGDRLIVLVNNDASVAQIKGQQRPINDLSFRQQMLAALDCVDYICHFDTPSPAEQIKIIQPDLLVKGGDYEISDIAGSKYVLDYGGRVKVLPFLEGYSSTTIIEKIKKG